MFDVFHRKNRINLRTDEVGVISAQFVVQFLVVRLVYGFPERAASLNEHVYVSGVHHPGFGQNAHAQVGTRSACARGMSARNFIDL